MALTDDAVTAFQFMLTQIGVNITFGSNTKQCITGAVELERMEELAGDLPTYGTHATMLRTDYAALGAKVRSRVTIDGITLIIMKVDEDPADPLLDFVLVSDSQYAAGLGN